MSKLLIGLSLFAALGDSFTIEERDMHSLVVADPQQCIEEKCPNQCQRGAFG